MRLIDADKIGLTDFEIIQCDGDYKRGLALLIEKLNNAPTIEAEPIKHGRWVALNDDGRGYADEFGCTNCSCVVKYGYFSKGCDYERCPYCGAKMDEVEE